jgi:signal transduction histidine kinase
MDELLKQIAVTPNDALASFTMVDFILSLVLSATLSSVLTIIYRITHSGLSYSRSFGVTMILMSITISFIMLIIGSNLARAFSLVGALSIIRYRNAVKESRDTAFIFLTMAVGMACGVKLYLMAVIFTVVVSFLIWVLEYFQFGTVNREERLLQVVVPSDFDNQTELEELIKKQTSGRFNLLSLEVLDDEKVFAYSIEIKRKQTNIQFVDQISEIRKDVRVKILTGFEKFNI